MKCENPSGVSLPLVMRTDRLVLSVRNCFTKSFEAYYVWVLKTPPILKELSCFFFFCISL